MKKVFVIILLILCFLLLVFHCVGLGFYSSSSAISDLKSELETIYGCEYTGKPTENGSESMVFEVVPKTWLFTNWNLRNSLHLGYKYECKVVFTSYVGGTVESVRCITYQALDPMGADNMSKRAFIYANTKVEEIECR